MIKNVVLIDGDHLAHRNFFGLRHFKAENNNSSGLVYGYLRSLVRLEHEFKDSVIFNIFGGKPTRQKKIYKDYKGNRNYDYINDYGKQLKDLILLLSYSRRIVFKTYNYEADDTIGMLSHYYSEKRHTKVTIISSDKDFLQLLNTNVTVLDDLHKVTINSTYFRRLYGFEPSKFVWWKSIFGDKSDNIIGIKHFGLKKTNKVIQTWEKDYPKFKFKQFLIKKNNEKDKYYKHYSSLLQGYDTIALNKKLITLLTKVPNKNYSIVYKFNRQIIKKYLKKYSIYSINLIQSEKTK